MAVTSNLERYRELARLGAGGMSTVVLAEDTLLGRRVALKRLHRDDLRAHSRLRREALIGASLTHPNLVSIFDIFTTEDGDDVIVMEYVEGETLAQRLRHGGKPDLDTALRILTGVSAGLDAIHAQRIVHRDVKPGNILLGADRTVKLADLGIAAVADRTRITTDGAVLGTFSYMAPEQLEGAIATPAVDIYALAAVAFEVLSGKRAHTEPNPVALAHAVSSQPPPDLRAAWPEAPEAAAEVLTRGMCRDPRGRPRSAGELTARLREAFEPQTTAPVAPPRPRPTRAAPAAAAAAIPAGSPAPVRQPTRTAARPQRNAPPPPPRPTGRSRGVVLALVGLVTAAVVVAVVLATSPGSSQHTSAGRAARHVPAKKSSRSGTAAGSSTHAASGSAVASGSASSSSTTPASPSSSSTPAAGSPVAAVESFYHLAAAHKYGAAWALADPSFRNQLGGYQSFAGGQAADRTITFDGAQVTNQSASAATVYVRTTSVRTSGTQHCYGPVNLVRGSSGWLLDHININCS